MGEQSSHELDVRLARVEEQIKAYAKTEWVSEALNELTRTVDKMGSAISSVVSQIEVVSKGQEQLYKTHDALLKERAEIEKVQAAEQTALLKKRLEEKTATSIAKRWLPMASLLVTIIALMQIVKTLIELWLKNLPPR